MIYSFGLGEPLMLKLVVPAFSILLASSVPVPAQQTGVCLPALAVSEFIALMKDGEEPSNAFNRSMKQNFDGAKHCAKNQRRIQKVWYDGSVWVSFVLVGTRRWIENLLQKKSLPSNFWCWSNIFKAWSCLIHRLVCLQRNISICRSEIEILWGLQEVDSNQWQFQL